MVQEQAANKMMAYLKKMATSTARAGAEVLALLIAGWMKSAQDGILDIKMLKGGEGSHRDLQLLKQRGEEVVQITIPDEDLRYFTEILKHNKTFYVLHKLKNDDGHQITYLDDQKEKVNAATEMLAALYGTRNEISMETLGIYYDGLTCTTIEGLSEPEYEIFRDHAVSSGLIYSLEEENGKYNIYYGYDQNDNAFNAVIALGLDLSSDRADELLKKSQDSIDNRNLLHESIKGNHTNTIYLVNTDDPTTCIKVTGDDYTYYKKEKAISSLNRDEKNFKQDLTSRIPELLNYVVLTEDEYNMDEKERAKVIKERDNIYPEGFYDGFKIEDHTFEHRQKAIEYTNKYEVLKFVSNRKQSELAKTIADAKLKRMNMKQERENNKEYSKSR